MEGPTTLTFSEHIKEIQLCPSNATVISAMKHIRYYCTKRSRPTKIKRKLRFMFYLSSKFGVQEAFDLITPIRFFLFSLCRQLL